MKFCFVEQSAFLQSVIFITFPLGFHYPRPILFYLLTEKWNVNRQNMKYNAGYPEPMKYNNWASEVICMYPRGSVARSHPEPSCAGTITSYFAFRFRRPKPKPVTREHCIMCKRNPGQSLLFGLFDFRSKHCEDCQFPRQLYPTATGVFCCSIATAVPSLSQKQCVV